jgi:hypothetical protein
LTCFHSIHTNTFLFKKTYCEVKKTVFPENMIMKNYSFFFLKYFFLVLCLIMFFILMYDVWVKFNLKLTTTGVIFRDEKITKKSIPSYTICPWQVYRNNGFYYKQSDFLNNTFTLEDIFHNSSLSNLNNESLYEVKTVKSYFYGVCYTISKKVSLNYA